MNRRAVYPVILAGVFQFGWLFGMLNAPQARAASFTAISTCVVTVTGTATTVQALLAATPGCLSTIGECFKVANPADPLVCMDGSSSAGNSLVAGARCWSVCGAATCAETVTSVPAKITDMYLRAPVNQAVQLLLGNGC